MVSSTMQKAGNLKFFLDLFKCPSKTKDIPKKWSNEPIIESYMVRPEFEAGVGILENISLRNIYYVLLKQMINPV